MLVLIVVLAFETREYRRAAKFTQALDAAINAYGSTFSSLVETVKTVELAYNNSIEVHQTMSDQLTIIWNIIEVHNRALQLDPTLLKIGTNEEKIP
jgi:hypothetical protein